MEIDLNIKIKKEDGTAFNTFCTATIKRNEHIAEILCDANNAIQRKLLTDKNTNGCCDFCIHNTEELTVNDDYCDCEANCCDEAIYIENEGDE